MTNLICQNQIPLNGFDYGIAAGVIILLSAIVAFGGRMVANKFETISKSNAKNIEAINDRNAETIKSINEQNAEAIKAINKEHCDERREWRSEQLRREDRVNGICDRLIERLDQT